VKSLANLIDSIAPLYNKYKKNKKTITGTDSLEIMWDIGDLLQQYIQTNDIKPHNLYRQIYGKSEGSENISQKSYIPREFQGRCYRIRNMFPIKMKIREDLPTLKTFTCFREAMPFFDNPKYKLEGTEKQKLLTLLNSNMSTKHIMNQLKTLQRNRIGKKNPRTQKLDELADQTNLFVEFYNYVYNLINTCSFKQVLMKTKGFDKDLLLTLSKNVSALSKDDYKFFDFDIPQNTSTPLLKFANMIKSLIIQNNAKERRRFRRIIRPLRMIRLAEMIYALLSEENFSNFQNKIK